MKEIEIEIRCTARFNKTITVPESWGEDQIENYITGNLDIDDFTISDPESMDLDWEYK